MLAELRQYSNKSYVKKGQMMYQTGDTINSIYFLEQGLIKLAEDGVDGQPVTIAILEDGDVFGLLDRLNNYVEHTQYSVALIDSVIFSIPVEVVLKHLESLSEVEKTLFYSLVRQLDEARKVISVHSRMAVPERLSWFLQKLANMENGVATINIPLTHEEISYMVGCSRQKVTTYLNEWKKEGSIQYDRGFIQLVDIDKLP